MFEPAHILVADDDAWILRMVTTVLEKRGHTVVTATDGEEAFEKAVANPPDLVITDVMMPNMDGWTLIRALRARPEFSFIPVIFLTALGSDDDRIRGFRLGADDYLPKPFRFEELDLRVEKTMQRTRSLEAAARAQVGTSSLPASQSSQADPAGLVGSLKQVGISSLLVLMEMERKTGILTVTRENEEAVAKIYLRDGAVVYAEIEDLPEPRNELAIYFVLEWSAGSFAFESCAVERESELQTSTTGLLMEGARRIDERDSSR
jgi:DNA-binding response OmpR family regulator